MAAGAYSDVAVLGLTYAEDVVNTQTDLLKEAEATEDGRTSHVDEQRISPLDPKVTCWCSNEDFIIFSEFSEVQGPLPLLTIPSHVQDDNLFDMNAFILKIMSVDYQANQSGHFVLSDDTQVLQFCVMQGVHAYVHYFTLHDIHARGFVRPMCLAYVSRDREKLQNKFSVLREHFQKVTHLIKFNNRQGFLEDLIHSIHELRTKQDKYFEWKRQEEEGLPLTAEDHETLMSMEISQLVQQYTEYKHLQHLMEQTLDAAATKQLLFNWESVFKSSDIQEALQFIKKLTSKKQHPLPTSPGHSRIIRPVLAISPWGCLVGLWTLLDVIHTFSPCSLQVHFNAFITSFMPAPKVKPPLSESGPDEALLNKQFLQLIHNLTYPKEWGEDESMDATVASQDDLDFLEAHFLASGNEGSSSYHSAPGSVSGLTSPSLCTSSHAISSTPVTASSSSSGSFHEVTEELTEWSSSSNDEDREAAEPWTGCLWSNSTYPQNKPGFGILQFFLGFPQAAQHIVYSILIGRSVVLSGSRTEQIRVLRVVNALAPLLPGVKPAAALLKWHQGIIVPDHIKKYKLIGVCVPERLSVHDMVSSRDKNSVTILEVGSKQLFGPAYSGKLLAQLEPSCVSLLPSDETLLLLLQAVFAEVDSKIFLCRTLGPEQLKDLGVNGCDLTIVKYLAAISSS